MPTLQAKPLAAARAASSSRGQLTARRCACGGIPGPSGECEDCRKKRLQRRLIVGESTDPLEVEAERVAEQVLGAPLHREKTPAPRIQRSSGGGADPGEMAPPSVDRVLAEQGQPLEPGLQADMTRRFGFDFSRVRIHAGAAAARSAREVNAEAYTVGHDVVFGDGRYATGTANGRRLIAHELTHVVQQSGAIGYAAPGPNILQRQETPAPPRKLTPEEYKKLDPALQVMTWGPDFVSGLKRSGVSAQLSSVGWSVVEKGFTESNEHPIQFRAGVMVGLPIGIATAVGSALKSLAELAWELAKLWLNPAKVVAEVIRVAKENLPILLQSAEPLGFGVGKLIAQDATKFGIEFFNSSPFSQGMTVGQFIGRLIGEVGLLFVGVGEVSAAAKVAANTRFGRLLLEALEASKLLKPLVETTEGAKAARAAQTASGEAAAAKDVAKAAQEAKPAVTATEDAAKTGGAARAGETAKDALPASVAKDTITEAEMIAEANFVDSHPNTIVSDSPPRAKLDQHEIEQMPDGFCERHSKRLRVPCPQSFSRRAQPPANNPAPAGNARIAGSDLPHGEIPFGRPGEVPGGFEYLRDQTGRPTAVEGWWNAEGAPRDPAAQKAVSGPYNTLAPNSTNASHLAGRQGGGRGDAVNLVPTLREINHPQMSGMENRIAKRVAAGEQVYIQVRVSYQGTGNIPQQIEYRVYALKPNGDTLVMVDGAKFGGEAPVHFH